MDLSPRVRAEYNGHGEKSLPVLIVHDQGFPELLHGGCLHVERRLVAIRAEVVECELAEHEASPFAKIYTIKYLNQKYFLNFLDRTTTFCTIQGNEAIDVVVRHGEHSFSTIGCMVQRLRGGTGRYTSAIERYRLLEISTMAADAESAKRALFKQRNAHASIGLLQKYTMRQIVLMGLGLREALSRMLQFVWTGRPLSKLIRSVSPSISSASA